jgi:hypothetical protein
MNADFSDLRGPEGRKKNSNALNDDKISGRKFCSGVAAGF